MTDLMNLADTPQPAQTGTPFTALMLVEGLETSDGRLNELGTVTWREPPFAFTVQDTSPHGPGDAAPAWAAGQIDQITRDPTDPSRIIGRGHFMPNEVGRRAEELARHSFRGVSINGFTATQLPPDLQVTTVDQDGNPAEILFRFSDTVISELTMVPTPAYAACCLWFDDEDMPQCAANAHGAVLDPNAPPEMVVLKDPYESLVASAGGPLNPPRAWFFTPEPDEYQPLEVSRDGHITGHVAREGQCHLTIMEQQRVCQTAPMSQSVPPFKAFHRTIATCADGTEVACGWIAADTKHASTAARVSATQAADHYDNTSTLTAKVRLSNGRYGTWASGALMPGLDDRRLAIMQGPEVSGDWRPWTDPDTGQRYPSEIQAVLCVPQPALPGTRTRPELLVASDGQVLGMFGHFEPCCDDCNEETRNIADIVEATIREDREHYMEQLVASIPNAVGQVDEHYADALIASMDDPVVVVTAQERAHAFAKYDADERTAMAADGRALLDGSCAIGDDDDLKLWIRASATGDSTLDAKVRRHVMRCAAALGKAALVPSGWLADGALKE